MEALHYKLINYTLHWYFRHLGRCLAFLAIVLIKLWHQKKIFEILPQIKSFAHLSFHFFQVRSWQRQPGSSSLGFHREVVSVGRVRHGESRHVSHQAPTPTSHIGTRLCKTLFW